MLLVVIIKLISYFPMVLCSLLFLWPSVYYHSQLSKMIRTSYAMGSGTMAISDICWS